MNKVLQLLCLSMSVLVLCGITSCKKQKISPVYYDVTLDVEAPVITWKFPAPNYTVTANAGYPVHIIGNVNDLQSIGKAGQLYSFNVQVEELDTTGGIPIVIVLNANLPVDKKDAYLYIQQFNAPSVLGTHYYKLTMVAKDYASRTTSVFYEFKVNVQP